jgi:pimeloyl-ACP methyl ester carboxylesterase
LLLHGWPYDIHSFVEVAPLLVAKGYRVIIPHLRGYGTTVFRSEATPRNAQPAALAADGIALMDALQIQKAIVAGSIGAPGRRTSWRSSGHSAARRSFRSAAI